MNDVRPGGGDIDMERQAGDEYSESIRNVLDNLSQYSTPPKIGHAGGVRFQEKLKKHKVLMQWTFITCLTRDQVL